MASGHPLSQLIAIMKRLRDPDGGCPWDLEQDFASIAPYTIEEAYEVADAIARNDMADLRDELGDLLFQVVFHAQMASERGAFDIADVADAIVTKMIRRHPHVFDPANDGSAIATAGDQIKAWEVMKAAERGGADAGTLAGVAQGLPALMRAQKIQRRAARTGFDWPDVAGPRAKIVEELAETDAATNDAERHEELGDLLFSVVNYARHIGVDAEHALRDATIKFERRFNAVERDHDGALTDLSPEALDTLWEQAKASLRDDQARSRTS
ncbi:nucleoside triphosphate pyrophosphohydrolase [Sphingorhabdus soli]|uniref:Nucleoside triphosphate pyrophosphohydrolase n=2 Tax=Flavisphingopyxis soli TaxID=2601267 RepID=A0A5C6UBK5_9SPHN|nr:nucleoside triphosphate pyrophosphohydrolase [Sphingorhabdus soli]